MRKVLVVLLMFAILGIAMSALAGSGGVVTLGWQVDKTSFTSKLVTFQDGVALSVDEGLILCDPSKDVVIQVTYAKDGGGSIAKKFSLFWAPMAMPESEDWRQADEDSTYGWRFVLPAKAIQGAFQKGMALPMSLRTVVKDGERKSIKVFFIQIPIGSDLGGKKDTLKMESIFFVPSQPEPQPEQGVVQMAPQVILTVDPDLVGSNLAAMEEQIIQLQNVVGEQQSRIAVLEDGQVLLDQRVSAIEEYLIRLSDQPMKVALVDEHGKPLAGAVSQRSNGESDLWTTGVREFHGDAKFSVAGREIYVPNQPGCVVYIDASSGKPVDAMMKCEVERELPHNTPNSQELGQADALCEYLVRERGLSEEEGKRYAQYYLFMSKEFRPADGFNSGRYHAWVSLPKSASVLEWKKACLSFLGMAMGQDSMWVRRYLDALDRDYQEVTCPINMYVQVPYWQSGSSIVIPRFEPASPVSAPRDATVNNWLQVLLRPVGSTQEISCVVTKVCTPAPGSYEFGRQGGETSQTIGGFGWWNSGGGSNPPQSCEPGVAPPPPPPGDMRF